MKGDIVLAGYLMTHDEWQSLDARSRALLISAATKRDDSWATSGPIVLPGDELDGDPHRNG